MRQRQQKWGDAYRLHEFLVVLVGVGACALAIWILVAFMGADW